MTTALVSRSEKQTEKLRRRLPELVDLEALIPKLENHGRVRVETTVVHDDIELPIYSLAFGKDDPKAPTFALVGGVHGLERIGTGIIIEYLKTFKELLFWDRMLEYALSQCRVVFYPMVNPIGIYQRSRSNANGVDLMRNAPIDSQHVSKYALVAGQRLSPTLPWYRGSGKMEVEAEALCDFIRREVFPSRFAISLDMHSGFGRVDRLWFPYANRKDPYVHYIKMFALKRKLDQALPNHVYQIEPQSHQYLTHGDLWDYLDDEITSSNDPKTTYLPLTLEMGSWQWVKKNPKQIFSPIGPFHPMVPHRTQRILRRHINLLDFMIRSTVSYKRWSKPPLGKWNAYASDAMALWYHTH